MATNSARAGVEDLVTGTELLQDVPMGVDDIHALFAATGAAVNEVCPDAAPAWHVFARGLLPCSLLCINYGSPLDAAEAQRRAGEVTRKESEDLLTAG